MDETFCQGQSEVLQRDLVLDRLNGVLSRILRRELQARPLSLIAVELTTSSYRRNSLPSVSDRRIELQSYPLILPVWAHYCNLFSHFPFLGTFSRS